jgi:hypothetical protein
MDFCRVGRAGVGPAMKVVASVWETLALAVRSIMTVMRG